MKKTDLMKENVKIECAQSIKFAIAWQPDKAWHSLRYLPDPLLITHVNELLSFTQGVNLTLLMLRLLVKAVKAQGRKDLYKTLSCRYSLDSSRWVPSDKYPCARVSGFLHHFVLANLATSSIRVRESVAGHERVKANYETLNVPEDFLVHHHLFLSVYMEK